MPRSARVAPGGEVYHVINRAAARFRMLRTDKDFLAFEKIMSEAMVKYPTRLLSYCLMGNHWHMVIWPREDGELSAFVRWLTLTHAVRWRVAHKTVGMGPLYQGRYKSFIIQKEESLELICRYVERNALSAGLVKRAEDWRWSSLWLREHGTAEQKSLLSDWPIQRGRNWIELVNEAMTEREVERIQQSMKREKPMGSDGWTKRMIERHGLERTIRPEGRPRKGGPEKQGRI